MRIALTQQTVERSVAVSKLTEYRDTKLKGLVLRVTPNGTKSFYCEYARGKRVFLGRADVLGISEARQSARAILADTYKGVDPLEKKKKNAPAITYRQFLENHYSVWARSNQKAYKQNMARLFSAFKWMLDKPIDQITALEVEKWRTGESERGLSVETINRDIASVKASLNRAVDWDLLTLNPLAKVKKLRIDSKPNVRFLLDEEEINLRSALDAREFKRRKDRSNANKWRRDRGYMLLTNFHELSFTDHLKPLILLSINTGLRRGELFDLSWSNVDMERKIITVAGTTAKSSKTRHVPLNREASKVVKGWRKQCSPEAARVFENEKGERFDNVNKAWKGVLEAAGIADFRWHDLRHHFASKLAMAGVDLNTIRELLGHSDYAMTLRYAHLAPEHKHRAVAVLDAP